MPKPRERSKTRSQHILGENVDVTRQRAFGRFAHFGASFATGIEGLRSLKGSSFRVSHLYGTLNRWVLGDGRAPS